MDYIKVLSEVSKDINLHSDLKPNKKQKCVHLISKVVNELERSEKDADT